MLTASTELPVAAGLSSSAALTLAAVAALVGLSGGRLDLARVCALAHEAEVGELGTGAGWMDFLACAHGGVNRIDAGTVPMLQPLAPRLGVPVVVIDTRERRTTRAVLASKRARFRSGEPAMLVYSRQAAELVDALTETLAGSVVDYRQVGRLLTAGQVLLRDKVGCSTDLIDACVRRVLKAGAFGAKLTGSGHGGCLFALVPHGALTTVLQAVADLPVHSMALPATEARGLLSVEPDAVGADGSGVVSV